MYWFTAIRRVEVAFIDGLKLWYCSTFLVIMESHSEYQLWKAVSVVKDKKGSAQLYMGL